MCFDPSAGEGKSCKSQPYDVSYLIASLQEAEIFKELVLSDTSKALTHVFFAQRATTKVRKTSKIEELLASFE